MIILCVSLVRYFVLSNGAEFGPIIPNKGLRQSDPFFPYLFILCAEGLLALFKRVENRGDIHGTKVCTQGPTSLIFYLLMKFSFL